MARMAKTEGPWDFAMRVWFLALSRMNRIGHAEFGMGEVAQRLQTVDEATGEVKTPSAPAVSKAIAKLKGSGLLAQESHARCLVVPSTLAQNGKGASVCRQHGVNPAR
jgi:hypothetical protein